MQVSKYGDDKHAVNLVCLALVHIFSKITRVSCFFAFPPCKIIGDRDIGGGTTEAKGVFDPPDLMQEITTYWQATS